MLMLVTVGAAYFDLKKKFDLVDKDILLLEKLVAVGCTPKLLEFFANMRNRRQVVDYAG